MRKDLIETFVLIADLGSLNAAAERLRLSRSVVSDRLNSLEESLGAKLLVRSTHNSNLTDAGAIFLEHGRKLLASMEAAHDAVADSTKALTGHLRIAAPLTLTSDWLTPIFARFMQLHPKLTFEIAASDRTFDLIQDGFSLAIRSARHRDSALLARKLTIGRRILVCSTNYKKQFGIPQTLEQLVNHQFVVYRNRRATQDWTFRASAGIRSVRVSGRFEVDDASVLRSAAIEGLGIALLPTFAVCNDLISGRLLSLDVGAEPDTDAILAVYPKAHAASPRLKVFVQYLRSCLSDVPPWDKQLIAAGVIKV